MLSDDSPTERPAAVADAAAAAASAARRPGGGPAKPAAGKGRPGLLLVLLGALWAHLRARTARTYSEMAQGLSDLFARGLPPSAQRFDMVIGHDDSHVDVGGDATVAAVMAYLRRAGKTLPVVPFAPELTAAAALRRCTAGRGSAAHGLFHDTVEEADVMCGSGQVIRCSRRENPALFAALAGSGEAALCRVLRVRLRVVPRPKDVTVHAIRASDCGEARRIVDDMVRMHPGAVLDAEIVVSGPESATVLVAEAGADADADHPLVPLSELLSLAEAAKTSPEGRTVAGRVAVAEWWSGKSRSGTSAAAVPQVQLGRFDAGCPAEAAPRWYAYVAPPAGQWTFAPNGPVFACWADHAEGLARLAVGVGGRPIWPQWAGDGPEHFYGFTLGSHVHQIRSRTAAHDAVREQLDPTGRFATVYEAHGGAAAAGV